MNNYLDLTWLKNNHQMIHYFGLGFIQIKINDSQRMHFYSKELPAIIPKEEIHNHRYNFNSKIIKGKFKQEIFDVIEGHDWILEQESCNENKPIISNSKKCNVVISSSHTYCEGSEYYINHQTFHRVEADYAITLLTRSGYEKDFAEVIRPINFTKICPFSQKIDEQNLWNVVKNMLG